jgi:hypothetical protein
MTRSRLNLADRVALVARLIPASPKQINRPRIGFNDTFQHCCPIDDATISPGTFSCS